MKCVSIRQPQAQAVALGVKPVENRSRNIVGTFRGDMAVHVSKTPASPLAVARACELGFEYSLPLYLGQVIAVVRLVGVHRPGDRPDCQPGRLCSPWAEEDMWHLVLENPRRLRYPMMIPGKLGLWQFPDKDLDGRWPDQDEAHHG